MFNSCFLKIIVLASLFFVSAGMFLSFDVAHAQRSLEHVLSQQGISAQDYQKFTTYYYQNPQADKLMLILKAILNYEKMLMDKMHSRPFAHFVATVARDNREFFDSVKVLESNYSGLAKEFLGEIINQTENFSSPQPITPFQLDYLWAEFIATGDAAPVNKIVTVLNYQKPVEGKQLTDYDMGRALTFSAAKWSLASNAEQHEKVYEIIKNQATEASGVLKNNLDEIIEKVEENQADSKG